MLTHLILIKIRLGDCIIILGLQIKKLKFKMIKQLAQSHKPSKWYGKIVSLESIILITTLQDCHILNIFEQRRCSIQLFYPLKKQGIISQD